MDLCQDSCLIPWHLRRRRLQSCFDGSRGTWAECLGTQLGAVQRQVKPRVNKHKNSPCLQDICVGLGWFGGLVDPKIYEPLNPEETNMTFLLTLLVWSSYCGPDAENSCTDTWFPFHSIDMYAKQSMWLIGLYLVLECPGHMFQCDWLLFQLFRQFSFVFPVDSLEAEPFQFPFS